MRTRKITHLKNSLRKTQTRRAKTRARTTLRRRRAHCTITNSSSKVMMMNATVSDKLQTLNSLIPGGSDNANKHDHNGMIKAEQLFKRTADYIILLKTRVLILQRLIQLYGSTCTNDNQDVNVL